MGDLMGLTKSEEYFLQAQTIDEWAFQWDPQNRCDLNGWQLPLQKRTHGARADSSFLLSFPNTASAPVLHDIAVVVTATKATAFTKEQGRRRGHCSLISPVHELIRPEPGRYWYSIRLCHEVLIVFNSGCTFTKPRQFLKIHAVSSWCSTNRISNSGVSETVKRVVRTRFPTKLKLLCRVGQPVVCMMFDVLLPEIRYWDFFWENRKKVFATEVPQFILVLETSKAEWRFHALHSRKPVSSTGSGVDPTQSGTEQPTSDTCWKGVHARSGASSYWPNCTGSVRTSPKFKRKRILRCGVSIQGKLFVTRIFRRNPRRYILAPREIPKWNLWKLPFLRGQLLLFVLPLTANEVPDSQHLNSLLNTLQTVVACAASQSGICSSDHHRKRTNWESDIACSSK